MTHSTIITNLDIYTDRARIKRAAATKVSGLLLQAKQFAVSNLNLRKQLLVCMALALAPARQEKHCTSRSKGMTREMDRIARGG